MPDPAVIPVLAVEQVSKSYTPNVRALDAVRFTIRAGERVCLLGPNGAGKTTLLRIITGALRPDTGSIALFGQRARDREFLAARRRVGIVAQSPGMYRDLTVGEYLTMVQRLYRRGSMAEMLERFALGPFEKHLMATLSGGFQRRLALAAAFLSSPELLLLDEPTVGLDPVATREVHVHLREMTQGRTTLLCTHNLAEAEALCDTVVILRAGCVLRHQPIRELRADVQPRLALAAAQGIEALAHGLAAMGHACTRDGAHAIVAVTDAVTEAPMILRALLTAGIDVYECKAITPSLEELFLEIVRSRSDQS